MAGPAAEVCDGRVGESAGAYRAAAVLRVTPLGFGALLGLMGDAVCTGMPVIVSLFGEPKQETLKENGSDRASIEDLIAL